MNAIDTLLSRASSSRLTPPVPAGHALEQVLASVGRAPDHGALRPWRLLVIDGPAALARLADAGARALRRREPEASEADVARQREKLTRAPMVIVLGARVAPHAKIPEGEQLLSVGAAGMNLLNALHALGFAGKWVTGPNCEDDGFRADLGFAADERVYGLIMAGTADAAASPKPAALDGLVRRWGD